MVCEYGTPSVPSGNDAVVMASGGGETFKLRAFAAIVAVLSLTWTVNGKVP
jgi:hypothetical protein